MTNAEFTWPAEENTDDDNKDGKDGKDSKDSADGKAATEGKDAKGGGRGDCHRRRAMGRRGKTK